LAQQAYQYDLWQERGAPRQPQLKVNRGGATRAGLDLELVKRVALTALMLALVCSVLYSQAQLSELTMDVQNYQAQLKEEQNTYNYLSGELNSKTNMKNVEEVASGQLGLVKLDPTQVTYFTLEGESKVDKPESGTQKLAGWFESGLLSLMENLDP